MKFYVCKHCGNIITFAKNTGVPVMCCGAKMEELIPGATDGAHEKHVPDVTVEGNHVHVQVGSVVHPMLDAHHIEWIAIETKLGGQFKKLVPEAAPEADFLLAEGDALTAVYEYCNLHGLWKKDWE